MTPLVFSYEKINILRHEYSLNSCTRTTSTFELDLHFGPYYTPAKLHICISQHCCAFVLTSFSRLSRTNIQTPPKVGCRFSVAPADERSYSTLGPVNA